MVVLELQSVLKNIFLYIFRASRNRICTCSCNRIIGILMLMSMLFMFVVILYFPRCKKRLCFYNSLKIFWNASHHISYVFSVHRCDWSKESIFLIMEKPMRGGSRIEIGIEKPFLFVHFQSAPGKNLYMRQ